MNKSILVLDENSVIHGLVTSALETEGLTLHHEFNPGRYVERATSLMPDLILLGKPAQDKEYAICDEIKAAASLAEVPMVLMAGSKEQISGEQLSRLQVDGVVRKPFEASDLQQQVSKHLNLVDLIGSAYEYRQSQATTEDGPNPLANLDVLDEEVLGLMRQGAAARAPAADAGGGAAGVGGTPVVDDDVLADTLQPERAFEPVDAPRPAATPPPQPGTPGQFDTLETLEGEFPDDVLAVAEGEGQLDELGAADVLEEESPEEVALQPAGFDEDLEADARPAAAAEPLEEIEVELADGAMDMDSLEGDLEEGAADLFEPEEPAPAGGSEIEESIPLSVRRMMELKPVFTMTQEETAADDTVEAFTFDADSSELSALQDDIGEVDLDADDEEVQEQELEFASEQDLESVEADLGTGAADAEPADDEPPIDAAGMDDDELDAAEIGADALDELDDVELEPVSFDDEPAAAPEPAPAEAEAPAATARAEDVLEPVSLDDDELEPVSLDDEEPPAAADASPAAEEPTPAPAAQADVTAVADETEEDFFVDEYLGDDEIDPDQIIAAEEEEPEDQPELSPEDEAELDELMAEDEHLAGLDDMDSLEDDALLEPDEGAEDDDVELDTEEEDQILHALDAEHETDVGIVAASTAAAGEAAEQDPLVERNFKALEDEDATAPADADAPAEPGADDETWALEQDEGGFAVADADDGEPAAAAEEDIISLDEPEPEAGQELAGMDEVPASALEEVTDDEAVAIELGEGEPGVFAEDTAEEGGTWKPKAPSGFVASPTEDFPEDAVGDPFTGPEGHPDSPEPPTEPRHQPDEVLEDPNTLGPVTAESAPAEEADLADQVREEDLEEPEPIELDDDDTAGEPSLTVLTDDALGAVEPDSAATGAQEDTAASAEPGAGEWDSDLADLSADAIAEDEGEAQAGDMDESRLAAELGDEADDAAWEAGAEMDDAFEPVQLDAEQPAAEQLDTVELETVDLSDGDEADSDVSRDEVDALLSAGVGEAAEPAADEFDAMAAMESAPADDAGEASGGEAAVGGSDADPEFDNLFASLREEIAANPEGERLDDVLRNERIRDRVGELELALPQQENTFARAMGVYELPGMGGAASAYPAALQGNGTAPAADTAPAAPAAQVAPAAPAAAEMAAGLATSVHDVSALSLLDPDIRAKLGEVLDEIISISVRKAVQEEMPKIMERLSKDS